MYPQCLLQTKLLFWPFLWWRLCWSLWGMPWHQVSFCFVQDSWVIRPGYNLCLDGKMTLPLPLCQLFILMASEPLIHRYACWTRASPHVGDHIDAACGTIQLTQSSLQRHILVTPSPGYFIFFRHPNTSPVTSHAYPHACRWCALWASLQLITGGNRLLLVTFTVVGLDHKEASGRIWRALSWIGAWITTQKKLA